MGESGRWEKVTESGRCQRTMDGREWLMAKGNGWEESGRLEKCDLDLKIV